MPGLGTYSNLPWCSLVIGIEVTVFLFESWLGSRQRAYYDSAKHPTISPTLQPYMTEDTKEVQERYSRSQAYESDRAKFASVSHLIGLAESVLLLTPLLGWLSNAVLGTALPPQWTLLRGYWDAAALFVPAGEIWRSVAFSVLMTLSGTLISAPKSWYSHFVVEERHGFNKMTPQTFLSDTFKTTALTALFQGLIVVPLIKIVHAVGPSRILPVVGYIMAFVVCLQLVLMVLIPYVIAPLFNKYTPLDPASSIFPKLSYLIKKVNFPLGRVWVTDGSTRSSHSNAFFYGLPYLTKHIVIYDTLLEQATPDQVTSILAHELGHWKGNHMVYLLGTGLGQTAISLMTMTAFLYDWPLLAAFGFAPGTTGTKTAPVVVSLIIAGQLLAPLSSIMGFINNSVTRHFEYDADAFAVRISEQGSADENVIDYGENLKTALVKIHSENLNLCDTDRFYSAYHRSHPTLIERLEALERLIGKRE